METLKFEELFTEIQNNWQITLPLHVVESLMSTVELLEEERGIKALIHTICCKATLRSSYNSGVREEEINSLAVDVGLVLSNDYLTAKLTGEGSCSELEDMFVNDLLTIKMIIDLYFNLHGVDRVKTENTGYNATAEGKLFTSNVVDKFGLVPRKRAIVSALEKAKGGTLALKITDSVPFEGMTSPTKAKFLASQPPESTVSKLMRSKTGLLCRKAPSAEPVLLAENAEGLTKEDIETILKLGFLRSYIFLGEAALVMLGKRELAFELWGSKALDASVPYVPLNLRDPKYAFHVVCESVESAEKRIASKPTTPFIREETNNVN